MADQTQLTTQDLYLRFIGALSKLRKFRTNRAITVTNELQDQAFAAIGGNIAVDGRKMVTQDLVIAHLLVPEFKLDAIGIHGLPDFEVVQIRVGNLHTTIRILRVQEAGPASPLSDLLL